MFTIERHDWGMRRISGIRIADRVTIPMEVIIIIAVVAFAVGFAFLVLSLEPTPITEGEIYKLEYEPGRTYTEMRTTTHYDGDDWVTTSMPVTVHDDEDFVVYIEAWDEEAETNRTRTFYVDHELYSSLRVGDYFVYDRGSTGTEDGETVTSLGYE